MAKTERRNGRMRGRKSKFSEVHQKQIALTVLQENLTLKEASNRFGIPNQTISRWVLRYYADIEQTNVIASMNAPSISAVVPSNELSVYEDKLRQAQLKITALETMIELAEHTYKIAIRKNSGTKQHE